MMNREEYLNQVTSEHIAPLFIEHGYEMPDNVKFSCGFPSRNAAGIKNRTIGQCHYENGGDYINIFISPVLDDSVEVLGVLIHELIHAVVGAKAGHKKPFKHCADALGLSGKMTATTVGDQLRVKLESIIDTFGKYPHQAIELNTGKKKQTTRMIKVACLDDDYIVRMSNTTLQDMGAPICPCCNTQMQAV
jgi:hypothetical protein